MPGYNIGRLQKGIVPVRQKISFNDFWKKEQSVVQ